MVINKQQGNMYGFVTHTWNPIRGKCMHNCKYCYMNVYEQKPLQLIEKYLNDNLGNKNYIFVGSSTDMFAKNVPFEWIKKVLLHCNKYPKNTYLFQSKNPKRMKEVFEYFPINTIVGTTIETNRKGFNYDAPRIRERLFGINTIPFPILITMEPIMDFDLNIIVSVFKHIHPLYMVAIGADSKQHNLIEPSKEKILDLIKELEKFTKVFIKDNLQRILKKEIKNNLKFDDEKWKVYCSNCGILVGNITEKNFRIHGLFTFCNENIECIKKAEKVDKYLKEKK